MRTKSYIKLGNNLYIPLEKAKDLTKLIKKRIVDKNGHVKTVYVKADDNLNIKRSVEIDKRKWFLLEKKSHLTMQ